MAAKHVVNIGHHAVQIILWLAPTIEWWMMQHKHHLRGLQPKGFLGQLLKDLRMMDQHNPRRGDLQDRAATGLFFWWRIEMLRRFRV